MDLPRQSRGAFIVLEGLDRSGKTTQVETLARALEEKGHKTKVQRFPDRTTAIGKIIDAYLRNEIKLDDHAVHLLFCANRWEASTNLKETLLSGTTVICDRYSFSGIAYSKRKGLDLEWCWSPERGLIAPDIVCYLTAPVALLAARGGYGNERYETLQIQNEVDSTFQKLATSNWHIIDASGSITDIHAKLCVFALDAISNAGPLQHF